MHVTVNLCAWQCASLHGRVLSAVLFIVSLRSAESASGGWNGRRISCFIDRTMRRMGDWRNGEERGAGGRWKNERGQRRERKEERGFIVVSSERRKEGCYERASVRLFVRQLWWHNAYATNDTSLPVQREEYLHSPLEMNGVVYTIIYHFSPFCFFSRIE